MLIVDLDPTSDDFDEVRRAARWTRQVLDELDLAAYLQVTGSRGVHVVTPLDRSATTDTVAAFASASRACWPPAIPARFTVEGRKASRGRRLYVDIGLYALTRGWRGRIDATG